MAKKTDFVVVTGDMIDFYETESTEGGLMGNQIEYKTNTQDFLDVLKETNNASVQLIVAGYIHRNDLFDFNFSEDFSFKQIITGAFRDNIDNWRLFQLTESDIMISIPDSIGQTTKIPLK